MRRTVSSESQFMDGLSIVIRSLDPERGEGAYLEVMVDGIIT
jgi:hypothetical protein